MRGKNDLLAAAAAVLLMACIDRDKPGICGDHVVDAGEACDAPGDGCDVSCHLTGERAWTVVRSEPNNSVQIVDIAVDPGGPIVVLGISNPPTDRDGTPWLFALDPTGEERWFVTLPPLETHATNPRVAVDADGGIYVQDNGLRRYDPDGKPGWHVAPTDVDFTALVVADGAIYTAGAGRPMREIVLQRREPTSGELVWERRLGDAEIDYIPFALAVAGDRVVALGSWSSFDGLESAFGSLRVVIDAVTGTGGTLVSESDESSPAYVMGALPGGDVVIAGQAGLQWYLRRETSDGAVLWDKPVEFKTEDGIGVSELAIGPDETIVVAGSDGFDPRRGFVRSFSSAGELAWNVDYVPESASGILLPTALAFGPGFLVVGALEDHGDPPATGWIQKVGPD